MSKTIPILLFVLSFTALAFGQAPSPPCPSISVSGPAGMPTGNRVQYSVAFGREMDLYQPTYRWSVSNGQIIVGPDGKSVEVVDADFIGRNLTVTIEISGLPVGCANKASDTMIIDPAPQATKLDQIDGSLAKVPASRFDQIAALVRQNPSAMLCIIVSAGKTGSTSIKQKKIALLKGIGKKLGEDTRVRFIDSDKDHDKVVFWLVPAGADTPQP